MKKAGLIALICLPLGIFVAVLLSNSNGHSRTELRGLSAQLFEYGSVRFVHDLDDPLRVEHGDIFSKVQSGAGLNFEESCRYRTAYWQILHNHMSLFQKVDGDINISENFGMEAKNNCAANGIAGLHDLHDMSAKQNLQALVSGLEVLRSDAGWLRSVVTANGLQKNLVDVLVHMAPATHSIGVHSPMFSVSGDTALEQSYAKMHASLKIAQFADINSAEYWEAVDVALNEYSEMVGHVQGVVLRTTSPFQRKIAGRWLAIQTLSPRLSVTDCLRPRSAQAMASCP